MRMIFPGVLKKTGGGLLEPKLAKYASCSFGIWRISSDPSKSAPIEADQVTSLHGFILL
jgi:hypothetical protein